MSGAISPECLSPSGQKWSPVDLDRLAYDVKLAANSLRNEIQMMNLDPRSPDKEELAGLRLKASQLESLAGSLKNRIRQYAFQRLGVDIVRK